MHNLHRTHRILTDPWSFMASTAVWINLWGTGIRMKKRNSCSEERMGISCWFESTVRQQMWGRVTLRCLQQPHWLHLCSTHFHNSLEISLRSGPRLWVRTFTFHFLLISKQCDLVKPKICLKRSTSWTLSELLSGSLWIRITRIKIPGQRLDAVTRLSFVSTVYTAVPSQ